jgi:hypothetical protein
MSLILTPCAWGNLPVSTVAREGTLEGMGQKQFSMKVPDAAKESMWGVLADRFPPQPKRSGRSESIISMSTLGFSSKLIDLPERECGETGVFAGLGAEKVFLLGCLGGG